MTKDTKILLTKRNSGWGVKVRPQSTNVYDHILDFATPELKEWFIAKELFGNEKTNWKSLVRAKSSKPAAQITDSSCRFTVDTKEYPTFTKQDFFNSDLAIILQTDSTGAETWTFFALNGCSLKNQAGNVYEYVGEIDIFFTYDVKDLFKDYRVGLSRAHVARYNDTLPNVAKNSLNSYPEDFFTNVTDFYPASDDILQLETVEGVNAYSLLPDGSISETTLKGTSFINGGAGVVKVSGEGSNVSNGYPYHIINILDVNPSYVAAAYKKQFALTLFSYLSNPYCGVITIPFKLPHATDTYSFTFGMGGLDPNEWTGTVAVVGKKPTDAHTYDIDTATIFDGFDSTKLSDLTLSFTPSLEGKIYHSDINQMKIVDTIGSSYCVPYSRIENDLKTIQMELLVALNMQGVYYKIYPVNSGSRNSNLIYGLESSWSYQGDRKVDNWDEYKMYNYAQFNNSVKIASRHEAQAKRGGILGIITSSLGFIGDVAGAITSPAKAFGLGTTGDKAARAINKDVNDIQNAKDELNTLLAQQQDMQNSPDSVTNGNPMVYLTANSMYAYPTDNSRKEFLQIFVMRPLDIIREKIAWLLHLSGSNLAGTLQPINDFLASRYYFNYVQTSTSLFENISDDLKISQPLREVIDASFRSGITIWHVRDKETFKGIKQYDVNNVEMELLTNEEDKVQ